MIDDLILKLEAGLEIDAMVCEKVMRLDIFKATKKNTAVINGCKVASGTYQKTRHMHEWGPIVVSVPRYSEDISVAMKVVEELGNWHGFDFLIIKHAEKPSYMSDVWEAGWYEWYGDAYERRAAAEAPTPELAICRAALLTANT